MVYAFLAFAGLFNVIFSLSDSTQEMVVFGLFNSLFAVLAIAAFMFKRWAVYALVVLGTLYVAVYFLYMGNDEPFLILLPAGYVFFTGLYIWRHKQLF